jgi:phosphate transport system permease protein
LKAFLKKLVEKFVEGLLLLSGAITSLAVLLIVLFLFKEGWGLFNETPVEKGSVISINKNNPVKTLTSEQIKNIFDSKITNWKEIGGKNDSIILFSINDIANYYSEAELGDSLQFIPQRISELIEKKSGIIAFFPSEYIYKNFEGRLLPMDKITLAKFIKGEEWLPTAQPAAQLGVMPLILGTLWVSLFAIVIALPFGLATAIYIAEIADARVGRILKPVIELLAGIPSVVYGFFGLIIIVPLVQRTFDLPVGETGLAGSIVLAIMALPTIITISEDAIRNTPRAMKEASLALGASHWQTISKVVIPYSISGISAATILGIGRSIGETMAVLMVTGNAAVMPHSILEPVRTIPATIAAELGESAHGSLHYKALFALGCILFVITLVINLMVDLISARKKYSNK